MRKRLEKALGVSLIKTDNKERLLRYENAGKLLEIYSRIPYTTNDLGLSLVKNSTSELGQDLVAAALNNFKTEGYFVEFGAGDGCQSSNTYALEQVLNWSGILVEPAISHLEHLIKNRRAKVENLCVASHSGDPLKFYEREIATLSSSNPDIDKHLSSSLNKVAKCYEVKTISLNELLKQNKAPAKIDYISIDTEGSELAILETFDFSSFDVNVFSIEHNFSENRKKIKNLMEKNNYIQIIVNDADYDDYYLKRT